jgi:uncharacterized spore protein YtfJ
MDLQQLFSQITDTLTVRRVFGEPVERDGVLVIPVARVRGGAGGGSGGKTGEESGSGGGMGFRADPAGVYVVREGKVSWQPAVDVNRIVLGGQIAFVALLLTVRAIVRASTRGR